MMLVPGCFALLYFQSSDFFTSQPMTHQLAIDDSRIMLPQRRDISFSSWLFSMRVLPSMMTLSPIVESVIKQEGPTETFLPIVQFVTTELACIADSGMDAF